MAKKKVKYCFHCGRSTVHNFICEEHIVEDVPLLRAIWAVGSLGLSELVGKTKHYQCSRCGRLVEID